MRSAKIAKHKILLIPLSMLAVTLIAGYFLSHIPLGASAVTTSDVSLRVKDTCTMDGNVVADDSNMLNGQEREGFHVLSLTTYCNDNAGFSIYAVGYSGDLEGSTDLTGVTTGLTISTADWADRNTGDNATKSIYSLKIEKDNTSYLPGNISILNGFTNYLAVPSTNTKVASYSSNTDTTTGSTINASYAVKVANLQAADTYTGKVKYTMVHPSSNTATGFTFDDAFQLAGKSRVSGTSYFAMQDMNAAICNKVTELNNNFPETELIDTRDNNVYTIKKINGDCWMTQNLRFTGTTLTPANSNVSANTTMAYYSLDSGDASYTDHCDSTNGYNYACIKDSGNDTTGVWYNYVAASAGTITTDDNTTTSNYDVCPAGWHLPTGAAADTSSEFYKIFQNTTANSWVAANDYTNAFKAVAGGRYRSGSLGNTDLGYWWSATADATYRYYLGYDGSQFSSSYGTRYIGIFVRCVADNSMQTFDSTAAASLAINESLQLRDVRDGNIYTVGKLRDGNVWLLDNLRLGGDTEITLTPSDTNIASDFTLPASSTDKFSDNTASWTTPGINTSLSNTMSTNGVYQGNIGVFYNYCAASAGTVCAPKGENASDASYDICPASWRMPTGGSSGEYRALYTAYNSDYTNFQTTLRMPLSGFFYNGSTINQSSYGYFWSSTRYDGNSMYYLFVTASGMDPQFSDWRINGYSVRCLLRTE